MKACQTSNGVLLISRWYSSRRARGPTARSGIPSFDAGWDFVAQYNIRWPFQLAAPSSSFPVAESSLSPNELLPTLIPPCHWCHWYTSRRNVRVFNLVLLLENFNHFQKKEKKKKKSPNWTRIVLYIQGLTASKKFNFYSTFSNSICQQTTNIWHLKRRL